MVKNEQGQGQSQGSQTATRERKQQELGKENSAFPSKGPSMHPQLSGLLANILLVPRPNIFEWHCLPHGHHSLQIHNTNPLNIQEMLLSYLLNSDFPRCIWSKKLSFLCLSSKKVGNARLTAAELWTQAGLWARWLTCRVLCHPRPCHFNTKDCGAPGCRTSEGNFEHKG